jgi:hypothetical protein|tara:strand:- start:26559 stop:27023 length:465 start_codon:yes stop_codon:yes gene_type:complete
MRLHLKGHKQVAAKLKSLAIEFPKAAAIALNHEAHDVLDQALEWTPVRTGRLRRTGKIQSLAKPKSLFVRITYGTNYALYVHEIPPGPKKPQQALRPKKKKKKPATTKDAGPSAKRRAYHAPPTRWKFLEAAVDMHAKGFEQRIGNEMKEIIGL